MTVWESLRAKEHCIPNIDPTKQVFQYSQVGIQNPFSRFFSLCGAEVNMFSMPQRILCDTTQMSELLRALKNI